MLAADLLPAADQRLHIDRRAIASDPITHPLKKQRRGVKVIELGSYHSGLLSDELVVHLIEVIERLGIVRCASVIESETRAKRAYHKATRLASEEVLDGVIEQRLNLVLILRPEDGSGLPDAVVAKPGHTELIANLFFEPELIRELRNHPDRQR